MRVELKIKNKKICAIQLSLFQRLPYAYAQTHDRWIKSERKRLVNFSWHPLFPFLLGSILHLLWLAETSKAAVFYGIHACLRLGFCQKVTKSCRTESEGLTRGPPHPPLTECSVVNGFGALMPHIHTIIEHCGESMSDTGAPPRLACVVELSAWERLLMYTKVCAGLFVCLCVHISYLCGSVTDRMRPLSRSCWGDNR